MVSRIQRIKSGGSPITRVSSDAELSGLLKAAVNQAERSGLEQVRVWTDTPRLEVLRRIEKTVRNSGLPGLLI